MIRLSLPSRKYEDDLNAILSSVRNAKRKKHLKDGKAKSLKAAVKYEKSTPANRNLKTTIRKSQKRAYIYYWEHPVHRVKEIKIDLHGSIPRNHKNRCPYCRLPRELESFDHVVEKAGLPELALYYRNLVPSCSYCNTNRKSTFDAHGRQRVIHFYDDDVSQIPDVLVATIRQVGGDLVAEFSVAASSAPMRDLYLRHFDSLDLAQRYSDWASVELGELAIQVSAMTLDGAASELLRWADEHSQKWGLNEPTVALFRGLALQRAALGALVRTS